MAVPARKPAGLAAPAPRLQKAPISDDPILTPSAPSATAAPVAPVAPVAPAAEVQVEARRPGRPPTFRTRRTIYISQELMEAVEEKHEGLSRIHGPLGKFPLANTLDAVFAYALEHWDEVAASIVPRDLRKRGTQA